MARVTLLGLNLDKAFFCTAFFAFLISDIQPISPYPLSVPQVYSAPRELTAALFPAATATATIHVSPSTPPPPPPLFFVKSTFLRPPARPPPTAFPFPSFPCPNVPSSPDPPTLHTSPVSVRNKACVLLSAQEAIGDGGIPGISLRREGKGRRHGRGG